jgi:hypothetical protein
MKTLFLVMFREKETLSMKNNWSWQCVNAAQSTLITNNQVEVKDAGMEVYSSENATADKDLEIEAGDG